MSAPAEWNAAIYSTASCQRFGGGPVGRVGPSDVLALEFGVDAQAVGVKIEGEVY